MDRLLLKYFILALLLTVACRADNDEDKAENRKDKKNRSKEEDSKEEKDDEKKIPRLTPDSILKFLLRSRSDGSADSDQGLGLPNLNELISGASTDSRLSNSGLYTSTSNLEKLLGNEGVGIGELPGSHQTSYLGHGGINEGLVRNTAPGALPGVVPGVGTHGAGTHAIAPNPINGFHNGIAPGIFNPNRPLGFQGIGLNSGQLGLLFGNVLLQAIVNFIQNAQPLIANMVG